MKIRTFIILLICFCGLTCLAQYDAWNIELVKREDNGNCNDVCAIGDYCLISSGGKLICYDMTDVSHPIEIGHCYLDGEIKHICVRDSLAFVSKYDRGLSIVDISDLENMETISNLATSDLYSMDITVNDNCAFLHSTDEILIADITDEYHPYIVSTIDTLDGISSITAFDDYLYLVRDSSIVIINVENPLAPIEAGAVYIGLSSFSYSYSICIHIHENYLYVTNSNQLWIYDLSNPEIPEIITDYTFDYSIINPFPLSIEYNEDKLLILSGASLNIVDVTDPTSPQSTAHCNTLGYNNLTTANHYAVLARSNCFMCIDINNPSTPVNVGGSIFDEEYISIHNSCCVDNYLFVANSNYGFSIFDISDSLKPEFISNTVVDGRVYDIAIKDNYAFLACNNVGLTVCDITDLSSPVVSTVMDMTNITDIEIDDDYAFVLDYRYGLRVVDISDPLSPTEVSATPIGHGYNRDLEIIDGFLLITNGSNLYCFDISDPLALLEASNCCLNDNGYEIAIVDDNAFVTVDDYGMQIIDISDRDSLIVIGGIELDRSYEDIEIYNNIVFLAPGNNLNLIDISDLESPIQKATIYSDDSDIIQVGRYIYYKQSNSLMILDADRELGIQMNEEIEFDRSVSSFIVHNESYVVAKKDNRATVFEVSDFTTLTEVDTIIQGYRKEIYKFDNYYVFFENLSFWIIDLTNPLAPELLCTQRETPLYDRDFNMVKRHEDYLVFGANDVGVYLYDISTITHPILIDSITFRNSEIYDIELYEDILFVSEHNDSTDENSVWEYKIFSSDSLSLINHYYMLQSVLKVKDDYLLASGAYTIEILTINRDGSLTTLYSPYHSTVSGTCKKMILCGDYVIYGSKNDGVYILDVSDMEFIYEVGSFYTGPYMDDMQIFGDYLYVTNSNNLFVLDISRFTEGITDDEAILPEKCELSCYPNPFNSTVNINLPGDSKEVRIYDISGRTYFESNIPHSSISWTPSETANSGVYLVDVTLSNGEEITEKFIYVK